MDRGESRIKSDSDFDGGVSGETPTGGCVECGVMSGVWGDTEVGDP